jgi:hypothetical protein
MCHHVSYAKAFDDHDFATVARRVVEQAMYFMYYNFCRIHQTLRVTPAMEAGLTDHVWTIEELLETVL